MLSEFYAWGWSGGCASAIYTQLLCDLNGIQGFKSLFLDTIPANMKATIGSSFWGFTQVTNISSIVNSTLENRGFDPDKIRPIDWIKRISSKITIYIVHGRFDMYIGYQEFLRYSKIENPNLRIIMDSLDAFMPKYITYRSRDLKAYLKQMIALFSSGEVPEDIELVRLRK